MKEQIKSMIIESIGTWTDTDIYALSLFVYDENDNTSKPTVTLGYNTERQVKESLEEGFADKREARWNYAFWLQNSFFEFGRGDTAETVKNWVIDNGFEYVEDDSEAEFGEESEITKAFVSLLVEIVRELHEEKVLTAKFGKELPILIHELEYYDEIADQNLEANGKQLVKDFVKFCRWC